MPIREAWERRRRHGRGWAPPYARTSGDRTILIPGVHARVHLGCGDVHLKGFLNVDFPPGEGVASGTGRPDLEADIRDLHCPSDSLDEIRLHHVFEHFERAVALGLLIRWYEWLSSGGRLILETPDFERCVDGFQSRSDPEKALILRHLFGSQEAIWAHHLDGWSISRFEHVLPVLGFEIEDGQSTWSDESRLLHNVVVTATKGSQARSRADRRQAARALLRESMNGSNETEERLFRRWCNKLEQTIG